MTVSFILIIGQIISIVSLFLLNNKILLKENINILTIYLTIF